LGLFVTSFVFGCSECDPAWWAPVWYGLEGTLWWILLCLAAQFLFKRYRAESSNAKVEG
jgi:hypothetical protein